MNKRFSVRNGLVNDIVQVDSLNERTRNRLKNLVEDYMWRLEDLSYIWETVLAKPRLPGVARHTNNTVFDDINRREFKKSIIPETVDGEFHQLMDFLDFACGKQDFAEKLKRVFSEENVGYRVVNNQLAPILDENSISAIESTLQADRVSTGAKSHIQKALLELRGTDGTSFAGSIRESVHAVEAECRRICGDTNATLGQAIDKIAVQRKDEKPLHKAMIKMIDAAHGYASQLPGSRHSSADGEDIATLDDAVFVLVTCSAFINWASANYAD